MTHDERVLPAIPALVNLAGVEEAERGGVWREGARVYFPGLSVRESAQEAAAGSVAGASFGPGRLWAIVSPALQVRYDPASSPRKGAAEHFSLMLQLRGTTTARQSRRKVLLEPGHTCVIDGYKPFVLSVDEALSHFIVLQMPRQAVLGRYPHLAHHTAHPFDSNEVGSILLRNLLLNVVASAPGIGSAQQTAVMAAIVELLGAPRLRSSGAIDPLPFEVGPALGVIDELMGAPRLSGPRMVDQTGGASGESSGRADHSRQERGTDSLLRRLEKTAMELGYPPPHGRTPAKIAASAGFGNLAKFSREFHSAYKVTPEQWRRDRRRDAGASGSAKDDGEDQNFLKEPIPPPIV